METAVVEATSVSLLNGEAGDGKQPVDVMELLQKQRESLKLNLQEMDNDIKKLSGRGEFGENRRSSLRRVPLKRESLGASPGDTPNKRRWGSTAFSTKRNLALEEAKVEEEKNKPTLQSSVVVTAKVADEAPPEPRKEDITMKKRNKRMFGLLLGTLKQFKQDSQMKTETESKQEEKMIQVEEKVQREKEEIIERKKDLIETRQGKRLELEELEFKIAMTELNQELKTHYDNFTDFIQLKSTPCIFYKPAVHNDKTEKLLKESRSTFRDSFEQRQKEISMCTEEDIQMARIPWEANSKRRTVSLDSESRRLFRYNERGGKVREGRRRKNSNSGGKSVTDPIIVDGAKTSEKHPIVVDGDVPPRKDPNPIVVDGDVPPRKGPITVYDDDNDYEENDVTIIDDKDVEEEDSTKRKKFRSVVVGGDRSEPGNDTLNENDEDTLNENEEDTLNKNEEDKLNENKEDKLKENEEDKLNENEEDTLNENEELPYTDWGQFVEDEEQVCDEPVLVNENLNDEEEPNNDSDSPPGDDDYRRDESGGRQHEGELDKGDEQQNIDAEGDAPTRETFTSLQEKGLTEHTEVDDLNGVVEELKPGKSVNLEDNELEPRDDELNESEPSKEQHCSEMDQQNNEGRLEANEPDGETEDSELSELELPLEDIPIPPDDPLGESNNDSVVTCDKDSNTEESMHGESQPDDDELESRNIFTDLLPPPTVRNNENSTDDFEYAEQLLEEVVDKKMGIVSPSNSYNVIDERVFSKSKESFGGDMTEATPAEISLFSNNYSWQEG